ncbi:hypothetical protein ACFZDG_01500 [Kitasatospora xanthocidica]|uniref:hypothetical protein n=1 Tax=Kitasatospora xanthocidica TaxID=83382 RepID=UPI0036EEEAF8
MNVTAWVAMVAAAVAIWQLRTLAQQTREFANQTRELASQTAGNAQALRATVYITMSRMTMDIDTLFIEHPELRAEFYGTHADERSREYHKTQATAELLIDFMDCLINHKKHLDEDLSIYWTNYFTNLMGQSRALQDFWKENKNWYGPAVHAILDPCKPAPPAKS